VPCPFLTSPLFLPTVRRGARRDAQNGLPFFFLFLLPILLAGRDMAHLVSQSQRGVFSSVPSSPPPPLLLDFLDELRELFRRQRFFFFFGGLMSVSSARCTSFFFFHPDTGRAGLFRPTVFPPPPRQINFKGAMPLERFPPSPRRGRTVTPSEFWCPHSFYERRERKEGFFKGRREKVSTDRNEGRN